MTQQYPATPTLEPIAPQPTGNGFGVTALVLGILAVLGSFIPVLGMGSFILGPLAIIFGIIGITRKLKKKGTSIAGLILGVVAIIIAAIVTAMTAAVVSAMDTELNAERTVEYVVTAEGDAQVSYGSTSGTSNADFSDEWTQSETVNGPEVVTLAVTGDFTDPDQKLSCEILIDGSSVAKETGTGMITCSADTFTN